MDLKTFIKHKVTVWSIAVTAILSTLALGAKVSEIWKGHNAKVATQALRDAKADEALKAFPTIQYDVEALKRESRWRRHGFSMTPTPTE